MRTVLAILIISLVAALWFYKQGKSDCEKSFLDQKIEAATKVNNEAKQIYERKIIYNSIDTDSNLKWLQVNCANSSC